MLFTDLVPSGTPVLRAIDIAAKESNVKVIDRKIEKSETDGIDFIHVLTTNNIAFANVFGRALLEAKAEVSEFETPEVKYSDVSVFIPVIMESFLNEVGERARFDRDGIDDVMDEYISLAIDAIYEKLPMTSKRIVGPGCHEALMSILRLYDPTYTNGYSISPKCEKECFVEHIRNHLNMFENNLNDDEYSVLEEKANEPSIPWIIVGTQDNIRGRQLSDTKYEFEAIRADGVVKLEIDLEGYSMQALEIICREK